MNWAWEHRHFLIRYGGGIVVLLSIGLTLLYPYLTSHAQQPDQQGRAFLISENDFLNLSNDVYTPFNKKPADPAGWAVIKFQADATSGMQAAAFQNLTTDDVVIAYEGTNLSNLASLNANTVAFFNAQIAADADISNGTLPQADAMALSFARRVANLAAAKGRSIYVTGHSLGGEEAEYVQNQADQPGSTLTISGGAGFADPGVPNAQPAQNDTNFTSYVDYGDAIGNFVPSGGAHVGNVAPLLGNSEDQAIEIALLGASGIGGVVGATGAATSVGMMVGDHKISHYATDLGITLSTTVANESDIGISDIMEAFSAVGASVFGGTGTPQEVNGNLVVNGNTLKVSNGAGEILFNDGESAEILTGSSKKINETTSGVNVSVASGDTETITAGAETSAVLVAESTYATLVAGSGKDEFLISGRNTTTSIDASTVKEQKLAQDTVTFADHSIAGNIFSGYTDQYGRTYTLNGTTLTIAINNSPTPSLLGITGFTNGDFGVNFGFGFTPLNVPAGSEAYGLNDARTIVGGAEFSTSGFTGTPGNYSTFDYQPKGHYTNDQDWDVATGINNSGQMVGFSGVSDYAITNPDSWVFGPGGFSNFVVPHSQSTFANAISDDGQIVGYYVDKTRNGGMHGFLDAGGAFTTLDQPGAIDTDLLGINDSGQIVGRSSLGGFLYTPGTNGNPGTFTPITTPSGGAAYVTAINNNGQMVGYFSDAGAFHGFVYDGTNFTAFALPATDALPTSINDAGDVLCASYTASYLGVPGSN